jgi:hypothetical protein
MDSQAVIAAGMLEGAGTSPEAPAADRAATLAEIEAGPTLWVWAQRTRGLDAYKQRIGRRVARWRAPTIACPLSPEIEEFFAATRYQDLRFEVSSLADWSTLMAQPRPHAATAAYVRRRAIADWQWRWPLRFGVLDSPSASSLVTEGQGSGRYGHLYSVFETDGSAACELLLITIDRIGESFPRAAVVVVLGIDPAHPPPEALDAVTRLGNAGIVFCSVDSLGWVEGLVVELSHDLPLDLALARALPNAVLLADPDFVGRATVRQWGVELSAALLSHGDRTAAEALDGLLDGRYASESGEATDSTRISEVARRAGIEAAVKGGAPRAAMRPPSFDVDAAPAAEQPAAAPPEAHPVAETPDRRRLQALVRCPPAPDAEAQVTDRFVAGAEHDIRVRIGARQVAGAVRAPAAFPHPAAGQDVTLDVSIIANGQRTHGTLSLPALDDSEWTTPVRFTVPPEPAQFAVYIEVAYQRRVIQSATLAGTPFELSIDVSEPAASLSGRAAAQGSITLVDGPLGTPTVLDLDVDAGNVNEAQIDQATRALRKELFAAFVNPPGSLAEAAGPLTRLAVRGRILYDRLAGGAAGYHDADDWIHVSAFSRSDVPIELAYTHPMPSSDTSVPVCPEALSRAARCDNNCSNRNNADVVCPFGFWATSKVIERRRHVHDRANAVPAAQRKVTPTRSSVVGVSLKADEVDATSSARILQALGQAVASASVVKSWQQLEQAAAGHPGLLVLVTHTIEPQDGDDLGTSLELNGDLRPIHRINDAAINPGRRQPGPVVLALGCDTSTLTAGYTDLVVNLHNARAEVVLSALSPIPGKGVADFLERFMPLLKAALAEPGHHRFGSVMLAARRATILEGDLMALALSATGDADVELTA